MHEFRCHGNIHANCDMSATTLVLVVRLVLRIANSLEACFDLIISLHRVKDNDVVEVHAKHLLEFELSDLILRYRS